MTTWTVSIDPNSAWVARVNGVMPNLGFGDPGLPPPYSPKEEQPEPGDDWPPPLPTEPEETREEIPSDPYYAPPIGTLAGRNRIWVHTSVADAYVVPVKSGVNLGYNIHMNKSLVREITRRALGEDSDELAARLFINAAILRAIPGRLAKIISAVVTAWLISNAVAIAAAEKCNGVVVQVRLAPPGIWGLFGDEVMSGSTGLLSPLRVGVRPRTVDDSKTLPLAK